MKEKTDPQAASVDLVVMPKPNPGSCEAIKKGCLCPVLDNHHGEGYRGRKDVFIRNGDCPLHDKKWLTQLQDRESLRRAERGPSG